MGDAQRSVETGDLERGGMDDGRPFAVLLEKAGVRRDGGGKSAIAHGRDTHGRMDGQVPRVTVRTRSISVNKGDA